MELVAVESVVIAWIVAIRAVSIGSFEELHFIIKEAYITTMQYSITPLIFVHSK